MFAAYVGKFPALAEEVGRMLASLRPQAYRNNMPPPAVTARVATEQASTFGWERYVGSRGKVIGMHTIGASAPLKALQPEFGLRAGACHGDGDGDGERGYVQPVTASTGRKPWRRSYTMRSS